jgi:hypothetical protein
MLFYSCSVFIVIALVGHSLAHIPQPLQKLRSNSIFPSSGRQRMAPSGQNITQVKHVVHFSKSRIGMYVFQSPVMNPTLDFEHTAARETSFQDFSLLLTQFLPP